MSKSSKNKDAVHVSQLQRQNQQQEGTAFFEGRTNTSNSAAAFTLGKGSFFQAKLYVHPSNDKYEKEADQVADQVLSTKESQLEDSKTVQTKSLVDNISSLENTQSTQRQPAFQTKSDLDTDGEEATSVQSKKINPSADHTSTVQLQQEEEVQKSEAAEVDAKALTPSANFEQTLQSSKGGGNTLTSDTQERMESHFGTDFSNVRIHTSESAIQMNQQIGAQAFTFGNNIFFNKGKYQPGTHSGDHLLAHELTHTIQQTGHLKRKEMEISLAPEMVQGFGILDLIPDWIINGARHIPGYTLMTVIIEFDPLLNQSVERTPIRLIEGLMGLVPFGTVVFDKLQEHGLIQRVYDWVLGQMQSLNLSTEGLFRLVEEAWRELRFPFTNAIEVITEKFSRLINRVITFANGLIDQLISWIKEAMINFAEPFLEQNRAWSLIKKIIHYDPLRDEPVEATTLEILEDFLLLIGRETELEQMRERGTLQETTDWLDGQVGTFMSLLGELRGLILSVWDAIQPSNLANIVQNIQNLGLQATGFLQRVWDFASSVATEVLKIIKDFLLSWLNSFAADIPGFTLLTVILGKNPLTDQEVPRSIENIIRGFMGLIPGGEAKFQELKQSGVIPRAAGQIEALIQELGISWAFINQLFTQLWNSFTINDLVNPVAAFQRIVSRFGEPISRLVSFVSEVVKIVLVLILEIMGIPPEMVQNIITNALSAFEDIKNDPVGFLLNLMNAVKEGFMGFLNNIGTHLLNGFQNWLFGTLADAGIQIPQDLSIRSILGMAMEILGVTVDNILDRLATRIGEERVARIRAILDTLSGVWAFVQDVIERGPIAIWEYVQEQLSNLWTIIKDGIMGFIQEKVIQQAITWLLSFLDVTGIMPIIRGVQTVFNAISSFIEKLREILGIVNSFVAGVADIARGNVRSAAAFLERALADGIPVAIAFLAKQLGLGNISEKIQEMVEAARTKINEAIDWLIDMALRAGTAVLGVLGMGGETTPEEAEEIQEGEYIYESPAEGGHTIRITPGLQVLRFSNPQVLVGSAAQQQQQAALESIVVRTDPIYPTDSLGRASGPHGHVRNVKENGVRENLPAHSTLPGGSAAYMPGDHRGHLIGDRFYGEAINGNLVPMNPTLNLSTFATYENRLAREYKRLLDADRAVLLYMEITPHYPGDNPAVPANYRPTFIIANSTIITLKSGVNTLQVEEANYPGSGPFSNPSPSVSSINVNTADLTELRNVFRTELANIIFADRNRNGRFTEDNFIWRIALQMGTDNMITRAESIFAAREHLIEF